MWDCCRQATVPGKGGTYGQRDDGYDVQKRMYEFVERDREPA